MPPIDATIKIAENMPEVTISPGRHMFAENLTATFFNASGMGMTKDNFHGGSKDLDMSTAHLHQSKEQLATDRSGTI